MQYELQIAKALKQYVNICKQCILYCSFIRISNISMFNQNNENV